MVNTLSKQIGELFKNGKVDEANKLKKEVEKIKPEIKLLQELLNSNNKDLQELLCSIPNIPNELVKKGSDGNDNEIIFESTFKVNDEKPWNIGNFVKNLILLILNWVIKSQDQDFLYIKVKEQLYKEH